MAAVSDAQPVPHVCPGTPGPCTASTPRTEPKTKKKTVYNLKFVGQVPDVDTNEINCFKPGKVCADGLERLNNLLKLDMNQVDLENLCQMDPNSFQQVEEIMEGKVGDGLDELLENELLVDEDEEDGGSDLVIEEQELRQTVVESEEDDVDEDTDDDEDLDNDTEPLFKQSSLASLQKMVSNNNRKRFFGSVESSSSLKKVSSPKRFRFK